MQKWFMDYKCQSPTTSGHIRFCEWEESFKKFIFLICQGWDNGAVLL